MTGDPLYDRLTASAYKPTPHDRHHLDEDATTITRLAIALNVNLGDPDTLRGAVFGVLAGSMLLGARHLSNIPGPLVPVTLLELQGRAMLALADRVNDMQKAETR